MGSAVCVSCKKIRIDGEWSAKIAEGEDSKTLGKVICPGCGPKTEG